MSCTAHHFWRGTCVIGHRWEGGGASSLGPRMYPTAPCLVLPAPWLSSDSPPSSRWGHRAGSTSNLSAGSGENNRWGCDKVQRENKRVGMKNKFWHHYIFVVMCCCVTERWTWTARLNEGKFWSADLVALAWLHWGGNKTSHFIRSPWKLSQPGK